MELIFGDCISEMAKMDDRSIDHVICDLPYYRVVKDDFDNLWETPQDYLAWVGDVVSQYARILKPDGNLFLFTSRQYNRYICNILDMFFTEKRIIIWCRKRGFNSTRGHALASGYEPICYYTNGNGVFNSIKVKPDTDRKEYTSGVLKDGVSLSDVWSDIPALPHNSKEKTNHPTQKPLALMERIVLIGTNPDDVVLDNCMGSGTTGEACLNLGRNFIGIECNADYFGIAEKRLKKIKLF